MNVSRSERYPFITGLKAIGAMMVILAHVRMQFSDIPDLAYKIMTFGGYFVLLFFTVSAFTVAISRDIHPGQTFLRYMGDRWLRLAPAFYAFIGIGLIVRIVLRPQSMGIWVLRDVLLHMSFLNTTVLAPDVQDTILGFEWMIPVMFWFYAVIPLMLGLIRTFPVFVPAVFGMLLYLHLNLFAVYPYIGPGEGHWTMQFFAVFYIYTLLVYEMWKNKHDARRSLVLFFVYLASVAIVLAIVGLKSEGLYTLLLATITIYGVYVRSHLLSLTERLWTPVGRVASNIDAVFLVCVLWKYIQIIYYVRYPHIIACLWFVALIVVGINRHRLIDALIGNRIFVWIGERSYGIYLCHYLSISVIERIIPPAFPLFRVCLVLIVTVISADFVFTHIETPALSKLRKRMKVG